jgi:hypothetical protein
MGIDGTDSRSAGIAGGGVTLGVGGAKGGSFGVRLIRVEPVVTGGAGTVAMGGGAVGVSGATAAGMRFGTPRLVVTAGPSGSVGVCCGNGAGVG